MSAFSHTLTPRVVPSANSLAEQIAWRIAQVSRGVGAETGLRIGMQFTHLRWTLLTGSEEGRRRWHEVASDPERALAFRDFGGADSWRGRIDPYVAREIVTTLDQLPLEGEQARAVHHEVFEALLEFQTEHNERLGGEQRSVPWLAVLVLALLPEGPGRIIDPACGYGEFLMAAGRAGATRLTGIDVNEMAVAIARMRLELAGHATDGLMAGQGLSDDWSGHHDTATVAPPWGQHGPLPAELRWDPDLPPPPKTLDLVWAVHARQLLRDGGVAVVHLPLGPLTRGGREAALRDHLTRSDAVEAVIGLPQGMSLGTRIASCLLVLRRRTHPHAGHVLFVDASDFGVISARNQVRLTDEDIKEISGAVQEWRTILEPAGYGRPGFAQVRAVDALVGLDGSWLPARHVPAVRRQEPALPSAEGRLLTELRLTNLRSFGSQQRLRLAPITLLYGPNAAGKSTVIQSLILLRQSLAAGRLVTQGGVDVGNFEGIVHRHDLDRQLGVGLSFAAPARLVDPTGTAHPAAVRSVDLTFAGERGGHPRVTSVTLSFGAADSEAAVREDGAPQQIWRLAFTARASGSSAAQPERLVLDPAIGDQLPRAVAELFFRAADEKQRRRDTDATQQEKRRQARRITEAERFVRRFFADGLPFAFDGLLPGRVIADSDQLLQPVGPGRATSAVITRQLDDAAAIFRGVHQELAGLLDSLAWLGPLRPAPQRFYSRSDADSSGLLPRGEDVALYLFDNESEVGVVNDWLGKLAIPYQLRMVALAARDGSPTVGDLVAMVLRDTRLEVDTSPADVGFGVSQALPIIVQLLASQDSVVAIEQPEIHLHPRLQADLGDLLIATTSADAQGNQAIVETHSEHLILRLQRRVREGALDPKDVSVLYVDLQDGDEETKVLELRLDDNGYFVDDWPQGFFDERADELFGGDE